ncbi:MAG: Glu/Leu/Phe/Val dehydrogenase dimerization domain-containing protein, partial [Planctomycetota bacterium]|nr:Glu/Leu/Phe/Val dehydrogenase dimerization domain-containing protein [Planctomycetota bacterium]
MEITDIPVEGYERVARCIDQESGLHALIAVHDTTLGPALGGLRFLEYPSEDDALFDVVRLARGMTRKSAVADTGLGGGKSVIIGNPETDKSPELLRAMGRFVDSFGGSYITAEDMNISIEDLRHVQEGTSHVTGLSREEGGSGNPSPYTAYGCVVGIEAAAKHRYGSTDLTGKRILIQGVGAVGGEMARLLKERGADVIICDIKEDRVAALCEEFGYRSVPEEGHLDEPCDIYAPCARGAGINDETIPRLTCDIVAGCANNMLLEPRHGDELGQRGILYAPDYVVNAAGIINVSVERHEGGYVEEVAMEKIHRIAENLEEVFQLAEERGIGTHTAAQLLAEL